MYGSSGAPLPRGSGLPNHPLPHLLHGEERRVYGDSAYASQKELIRSKAPKARDFTNQRTRRAGVVDEVQRGKNRNKSKIRARVEHVFAVVKHLWGFTKVRYRGLAKNANRAFVALRSRTFTCRASNRWEQYARKGREAGKPPAREPHKGQKVGAQALICVLRSHQSPTDGRPRIQCLVQHCPKLQPSQLCYAIHFSRFSRLNGMVSLGCSAA
ncbi:transposase [Caballeronia choica]|uniref:Transposase n=1 Tax=Caballeronia choica TaxID=326476 RepID=A0A158L2A5_9BURK|nr:transposase [Caballeronia choica]